MQQSQELVEVTSYRFIRREWRRNKPHLPKSVSLPVFKLIPIDRPIFTCRQCGFINTLIPLCLWCCWTSEAAHREFEESMPRARRASAPPRVFWNCTPRLRVSCHMHPFQISPSRLETSLTEAEYVCTPLVGDMSTSRSVLTTLEFETVKSRPPPDHSTTVSVSDAIELETSYKVTNTTDSDSVPSYQRSRRPRLSNESPSKGWVSGTPSLSFPVLRHSIPAGVDRHTPMYLVETISTKSLRSTSIVIDLKAQHNTYDVNFKTIDNYHHSNAASPTKRTLRRKKRVSLLGNSAPPLPRPQSTSTTSSLSDTLSAASMSNAHANVNRLSAPLHERNALSYTQSKSQQTSTVRLGHPHRPYYTAIRPNMSRPTSPVSPCSRSPSPSPSSPRKSARLRPVSLPTPTRSPSPGIFSVLSSTSALSEEDEDLPSAFESFAFRSRSASATEHVHPRPFAIGSLSRRTGAGFSLSGETELRMALARDHLDEDEFRFKDMGKGRSGARVMRKVREFKRGLKGLVTGKSLLRFNPV